MKAPVNGSVQDDGADSDLVQLVDELAHRLQAGEAIDLEAVARQHPERAEQIRQLLPAIALMADLGDSAMNDVTGAAAARSDVVSPMGVLGDFRIVREVGRGGMGVVYEAEQMSLGRRVALKVLPFAAALDTRQLRRFQLEAQAAACLHHTHIVPVHAVGCERGVHYYAMQFIDGRSLAEVVRELRQLDGLDPPDAAPALAELSTSTLAARLVSGRFPGGANQPSVPSLLVGEIQSDEHQIIRESSTPSRTDASSTRSRDYIRNVANLGVQAAEALEHAHQQGIVHRDIKPANLMLDERGHLWITDFGLARMQDEASLTLTGDVLGTLRYMSPEQAQAKRTIIDHHTDIYSLGVTLYELLSLRPALDGHNRMELLRQIAQEEPKPLSRLNPSVPRDLETIVHKALAKEPESRYTSAQALADDLRRFLEDKPIAARRPSLLERTAKWSRRHPSLVATTSLILTLVAIGSMISAYYFNRLAESERESRAAAVAAQRWADAEADRANLARLEADRKASDAQAVVDFFINDMLGSAAPEKTLGKTVTVHDVLAKAEEAIKERFADQPDVEASIRHTLGLTYHDLGEYEKAALHISRAVALRTERLGPKRPDTLAVMNNFADVLSHQGRYAEAQALHEQVLETQRRVLGPEHPETLLSMNNLANMLHDQGRFAEGQSLRDQGLEVRRRVLGPEHPSTLSSMNDLANMLHDQGRYAEAQTLYEQVLEVMRRVSGPKHPDTLASMNNLAIVLSVQGQYAQAQEIHEQALEVESRVLGPEHPHLLHSMNNLADVLRNQGRYAEAQALHEQTLEIRRRVLGPEHPDTLTSMSNLAIVLRDQGRYAEAQKLCEQALEAKRHVLGSEHPNTLHSMNILTVALWGQGQSARAQEICEHVLEVQRRVLGPEHPDTLLSMNNLAIMLRSQGQAAQAQAIREELVELY